MPNRFERRIGKNVEINSKIIRQNDIDNNIQNDKRQQNKTKQISNSGIMNKVKKFSIDELYSIDNYMKLELMYLRHKINNMGMLDTDVSNKNISNLKEEVEKLKKEIQENINQEIKKMNTQIDTNLKDNKEKMEKLDKLDIEKINNNSDKTEKIIDELKSDLEDELKKIKGIFPNYDKLIAGFGEKIKDINKNIDSRFEQRTKENEKILETFYGLDLENIKNIREENNKNFNKMNDITSEFKKFKNITEKFDMNKIKEIERNIRINTDLINEYKEYMNKTIISNENLSKNNEYFQKEINRLNENMTEVLSTLSEMKEEGVQYFIKNSNKKQNYNTGNINDKKEDEYLKNEQEKAKKKQERMERLKNKNYKGMALARVLEQRKHAKAKNLIK